jgi:hypothetical protein
MPEISEEKLLAFTEAHIKSAVALEKVTDRLSDITVKLDKISDAMSNGMITKIVDGVTSNYDQTHKETIDSLCRLEVSNKEINETLTTKLPGTLMEKINSSDIARDIDHAKLFIAVIGIAIIVCNVVLSAIDRRNVMNSEVKKIIAAEGYVQK